LQLRGLGLSRVLAQGCQGMRRQGAPGQKARSVAFLTFSVLGA
jgi:hypothetical protein